MARCPKCRVDQLDKHCSSLPQLCFACCTSKDQLTCPAHYGSMGVTAAVDRLESALVHPSIIAAVPDEQQRQRLEHKQQQLLQHQQQRQQQQQNNAGQEAHSSTSSSSRPPPGGAEAELTDTTISLPASAPTAASEAGAHATASSQAVAALQARLDADRARYDADRAADRARQDADRARAAADKAALDTQLALILTFMQSQTQRNTAQPSATSPPRSAASALPAAGAPAEPAGAIRATTPAPHRRAVLDPTLSTADMVSRFSALGDDDEDEEAQQVTLTSHTRQQPATVLPAAFTPAPSGSEQSAQQQLSAILNGLAKSTGKVKYTSLGDLNEALDDWAADSARAGWTMQQMESLRRYQRQVIHRLGRSHPLKDVLEYHRLWCKKVHSGKIDMFAEGAEFDWAILYEVTHPQQFGNAAPASNSGGSTHPPRQRKAGKAAGTAAPMSSTAAKPPVVKTGSHPAGSCANHPSSTTHTTTECRSK